jgi:ATP-binding cassette, subfamily B, bacterial
MTMSRYITQLIYHFRWWFVGQSIVAIIWAFDLSFRPYLLKIILDRLANSVPPTVYQAVWGPCIIYIILSALMVLVFRVYDYIVIMVSPAMKKQIATTLMEHMMFHSHQFYQTNFAGSLGNKIKDVLTSIPDLTKKIIDRFFSHCLAIIVAMITLWSVNIWFAAALTLWIFIFCIVSAQMSRMAHRLGEAAANSRSTVIGHIVDVLTAMMSVRLFCGRTQERINLLQKVDKYVHTERARDWYLLRLFALQGGSFVVYQAICIARLIHDFKHGVVTAGDFALVIAINSAIADCLWYLVQDVGESVELYGNILQGLRTILTPQELIDIPNAHPLLVSDGCIQFSRVTFRYKSADVIFNELSVTIPAGQKVGLVGYSGSGKSTFINLILRIFDIADGTILIDKQNIKEVTQDSLHQALGIIPQDPAFFNRSIVENIRYGRHDATDHEVIEAAKKAYAHEFIIHMPQGYNTLVGERGTKLSGGQRQRLSIARAILKNAPILMLDEATSQLDSITEEQIQESLTTLMHGKTVLAIAHRLSTVLTMDRILVFDRGAIVEDGPHDLLLQHGGLYATLWQAQSSGMLQYNKKK